MKDIMQKLAELEATAPKTSAKKMLKEDSTTPPMNVSNKPSSLRDVFEAIASNQPVPVVGKQGSTQQTGAGFINVTDNSPAAQALGNALGDLAQQKKVQIVVPTQQQTGQPAPAGATGQPQVGQMQMKEKDEGKPGKNFAKIAKSAAERYGSKAAGERVAGAVRAKLAKQGKLEEEGGDEKGAAMGIAGSLVKDGINVIGTMAGEAVDEVLGEESMDESGLQAYLGNKKYGKEGMNALRKAGRDGASKEKMAQIRAKYDKLDEEQLDEKFASQQQAKLMYATAGGADTDVSKKVAKEFIKKSHGQKVGKLPKKVKEGDIAPTNGIDTQGANLGAGRSQTTLEAKEPQVEVIDNAFNRENYKDLIGKKYPKSKAPAYARVKEISEGAKPDFLDLDKDSNKKESMKKAAADKKKQKVKESMNHRISAARLEGKSHGLRGHAHSGKRYEDLAELKAYHEGYKEGLDECYGQGVYENAPATPPATVGGMADQEVEEGLKDNLKKAGIAALMAGNLATIGTVAKKEYDYRKTDPEIGMSQADADRIMGTDSRRSAYDREQERLGNYRFEEDEMEEGNAFTGALAKTPKGGKFSVGGKTFTDNSSLEEYAFESADLDEAVFNPMGKVARELRGLKGIVKDTPHAQLPGVMGAGAGAAVGIPAAATAGAVGAAFLPIIGASALGGYGLLKAGQLTGKVLNFLAQKLFGTKEEALAFAKAHLEAARAGETSFQHNGKTYKVSLKPGQISQLYSDIEDLTSQIKNKELDKRLAPDTTMGKIGAALKEDPVFESWDRELSNLLNEGSEVNEGMSVSISKGQQNSPDSVTITAQDQEADELLAFVKQAGLGLFGADKEPSSAMSIQPSHGAADEVGAGGVDIDVVDGHDGMMGLMQKLSGVEASGSADYADEEGDEDCGCEEETNEATCNECGGMMEAGHSCGGKEMVDEVESEDQQEFEVAEDNAPDTETAEHNADEDAEAQEDAALAQAAQQNKTDTVNEGGDGGEASEEGPESKEGETDEEGETVSESFANLFRKLDMIAEESTEKKDEKAEKAGKKVTKDIEYDDKKDKKEKVDESEQLDELSPDLLNRAGAEASRRQQAAAGSKKFREKWENIMFIAPTNGGRELHGPLDASEAIENGELKPDDKVHVYSKDGETVTSSVAKSAPELGELFTSSSPAEKYWGKKADKFSSASAAAAKRDEKIGSYSQQTANMSPAQKRQFDAMNKAGELNEWANQVGGGPGKGTDASFEQDIEFMTKVIAGGLNKPKSTGQTTIPVIAGQEDRMHDNPQDWATLAGIKK